MNLKDCLSALQVRKFHLDTPVEASRTEKSLVQTVRPVGRGKDDHTLVPVKAVHLRKQLVESLLTLIVAASDVVLTALSDSVDLIDKDDARSLCLCLAEQVTNLRGAHSHEHLDEL